MVLLHAIFPHRFNFCSADIDSVRAQCHSIDSDAEFLSHLMTAAYPIFRVLNAQINSGFSAKSFGQSLDPRPGSLFLMTEIYKMKGPGNGSGESFDRPLLMGNFALCDSIFICILIHGGLYLFTIQGYHFKIGPMKVYCF